MRSFPFHALWNCLIVAAAPVAIHGTAAAADDPPGFAGTKWIWYSREPMPASIDFPAGAAWFRGSFDLPAGARVVTAELALTADNLWLAHVNGQPAAAGEMNPNAWAQARRIDVAGLLREGRNLIGIEAVNTAPGPAALVASLHVRLADGTRLTFPTNDTWKCSDREQADWAQPGFDDTTWQAAHVVGDFGMAPWNALAPPAAVQPAAPFATPALRRFRQLKAAAIRGGGGGPPLPLLRDPEPGESWPDAIVFVGGDCSLYRPPAHSGTSQDSLSVTIFNPHHGRAYPEHDLPAPVKIGRQLLTLRPARPGVVPQVLWDAGQGAVGPPAVSNDGNWVYFPMVVAGGAFFHLYRIPAGGGTPEQLTDGPFHDLDPCELPDGRLVFSSTRAGTFEEYHNPPSRALFTREATGRIESLTHTFQFDNEPRMLADGRLLLLRTDNFFDRGKVETMLHAMFPDGTGGITEFGLDQGPEYGNRLRAFNAGSAAPMPDGRVAWVDGSAVLVARPGEPAAHWRRLEVAAADVAALPDGRLVCTVATGGGPATRGGWPFRTLAILDPDAAEPALVVVHESAGAALHSPVPLGPRQRPPQLVRRIEPETAGGPGSTGVLFCQNVRLTHNQTAGWSQVRAIRVLAGYGLTLRSSHSYLVHAGSEVVELGTVPLAPDGSFAIEVPADTAIALQAVDAEGRSELNQMSWMFVRPGETRGCIGCHQPRQTAPPAAAGGMLQAAAIAPLKLTGAGDAPRFRGNNAAVTGLMELQFDRFREIASLNQHRRASAHDDREALLADLQTKDPARRHAAAQRAALAREPLAAPALAGCLGAPEREVRVAAAIALATCGTRESLGPLTLALADPDPLVAQAAAVALENLHGAPLAGFDAYAPAEQRVAIARAWQHQAPPPDDPRWLSARVAELAGDDRDQARRAAVALAHCGGPAATAALRDKFLALRGINPFPAWRADHSHRGDGARFNSLAAVNPRAIQEITRALGAVGGDAVVPLLAETVAAHLDPETANLFLAEAAVEALARIGSAAAESALLDLLGKLPPYFTHSRWYGDHDALIACHAAPVHARIVAALDRLGSRGAGPHAAALVRMVPTDPDRALLPANDDFETLVGRVIRNSGRGEELIAACLQVLGETPAAAPAPALLAALDDVHAAWAGRPCREIRAAQILSLLAREPALAPRVVAAFQRYRARANAIPRVYDKGIPVVTELPVRHWVCFYLARTLGQLGDPVAVPALTESLAAELAEGAGGRPDPLGPGVLFLHNDLTPCWRANAAWALGRIGAPGASPALLGVLADLNNAPDTRHAAAVALGRLATAASVPALRELAGQVPETAVRRALLEASARLASSTADTAARPARPD
jgi:HEAT repeat protein